LPVAAFDEYIGEVAEYAAALRAGGGRVREFDCAGSAEELRAGLPVRVGPGANPGIILRSDTFMELGNPAAGSCSLLLWTDDPGRVRDGRITLLGPGIQESAGASLPFAQVLIAAGERLEPEDQETLQQAQHVSDQIEGYMVRTTSENIWGRVSKEAGARGFDFEALGRALMSLIKAEVPEVSSIEVLFVTSSKEDVKRLNEIGTKVKQLAGEILKETWKARGYDMDCDFDCESCVDQAVCDEIREVVAAHRRKNREKAAAPGGDAGS